jgi:hypothetical protein
MNANFKKSGTDSIVYFCCCYLIQTKQTGVNNKDTDGQEE